MENAHQLANRFREVILNGAWVANTNYKHQLERLGWEIAVAEFRSLNTIATLAQHIHYYIAGINNVFKGGSLDIRDKYSFDFPPVTSQAQWENILSKLWSDAETFAVHVEQMPEEQLDGAFVEEQYGTYRRNIEAMIEHCYYHLAQIVWMKKIVGDSGL